MCHWCEPKRKSDVPADVPDQPAPPAVETVKLETSRYRLDAAVSDDYMLLTLWDRRLSRMVINLGLEGDSE